LLRNKIEKTADRLHIELPPPVDTQKIEISEQEQIDLKLLEKKMLNDLILEKRKKSTLDL